MEPSTVQDHDVIVFETSQIAWLRNEYGGFAKTPESGGSGAPVQTDASDPGNVASFFGSDNVVLPPRPNFAPPAKTDDNLFHIERLLKNNVKLSELTNEDWEKSFAEVQLMAFQNQRGLKSRGAALNALSSYESGGIEINRDLFKKSMEFFMDKITKPILDETEKKYADIWKAAEEQALEVVYSEGTVAEVAAQIREQFQKLLTEFKSGAVLLFQGSSWTSKMIRALTPEGGRFSHVAMYLPRIGNHTDFLLWQSGEEGNSKAQYHPEGKEVPTHARNGPDLHSFAEALALYLERFPGSRFVLRNIPEEHVPEEDKLKAHVDKLLLENLVYPSPIILAFGYQLGRQPALANFVRAYFGPMDEKAHAYFCSQLVASTYLNTETLDPAKMPAAGYSPSDFGHLLHESPNRLVHKKTNKPLLLEERELRFVKK